MMLQQFRVKLFQLVELREYLGTRVVGLDSGLLALIEKVSMRVSNSKSRPTFAVFSMTPLKLFS